MTKRRVNEQDFLKTGTYFVIHGPVTIDWTWHVNGDSVAAECILFISGKAWGGIDETNIRNHDDLLYMFDEIHRLLMRSDELADMFSV